MSDPLKLADDLYRRGYGDAERERDYDPRGCEEWQSVLTAIEAQAAELTRAKQWINDLQSGMYINCVYCGHRYGPESEVPASMADALKEHIEQCPEHPMSRLKEELAQARAQLEDASAMLKDQHLQLSEAQARIARLEKHFRSILKVEDLHGVDPEAIKYLLNESPRQTLAAVQAEALRELDARIVGDESGSDISDWIKDEIDRIEREAKEES